MLNIKDEISELYLKAYNDKQGKTTDPTFLYPTKSVNGGIDTMTRSPVLPLCFFYSNIALIQPREEGDGAESILVSFFFYLDSSQSEESSGFMSLALESHVW